jgi:hypothetical protein
LTGLSKVIRAVVGVVVLFTLLVLVNGWYGEYKKASHVSQAPSRETSASPNSTQVVAVAGGTKVIVLTEGVVLRATPASDGVTVRALKKGENLILVGTAGSWLQLREPANGKLGFVANDAQSVKVQR